MELWAGASAAEPVVVDITSWKTSPHFYEGCAPGGECIVLTPFQSIAVRGPGLVASALTVTLPVGGDVGGDPFARLEGRWRRTGGAWQVCHYMIQPLVELYGGCMVVLKLS